MNNNFVTNKYRDYNIYFPQNSKTTETLELSKKIIDKNYKILQIFKDTERNFVAKIEIDTKIFILKSPKAETIIPLRKIQTFFKKGEALESLVNLSQLVNEGYYFFVPPIAVIVKKKIFIQESFILMNFLENVASTYTSEFVAEAIKLANIMHKHGIYHGDLNISNFLNTANGVKVIDTQGKKDCFSNFKRSYDYLTLKQDKLPNQLGFNIDTYLKINKHTLGYFLAYLIKEFKYLPFIIKIRNFKKILREKGWKI
ncbi:MAG: lipopolysaccharide biosynthesis protein [Fusobacteriaceae bacterium]|nr:lipopolysaccharide biosynthesis protein [Fusobacteriaceae bacterium]